MKEFLVDINSYDKFCSHQYVSRETFEKFQIFYKTLVKWQKSVNLISNSSLEYIWARHFLDSAQLFNFTEKISFIKIDVEGAECRILNSIDFEKNEIKKIIFEFKHFDGTFKEGPKLKSIKEKLISFNYKLKEIDKENILAEKN